MGIESIDTYYKTIQNWGNNVSSLSDTSLNELMDFKKQLRETNLVQVSSATNKFNNNTQMLNTKSLKSQNELRTQQNNTTRMLFIQNYIYLILKIICFLLVFFFLYMKFIRSPIDKINATPKDISFK